MRRRFCTAFLAGAFVLFACDKNPGGSGGPLVSNPPETAQREISLGQTVTESLESASDVDEFAFAVPAGGRGMLLLQGTGTGQGALSIVVYDSTTPGAPLASSLAHGSDPAGVRFILPAGRLMVQVKSAGATGSYAFTVHAIATRPEGVDSVLPMRQWAAGDLAPYYDVDEYAIQGVQGQEVRMYLEVENVWGGIVYAVLRGPGQAPGSTPISVARTDRALGEAEPIRLPATGRYTLTVSTPDPVRERDAQPYRVMLFPMNRAPEGVPAELPHAQPVNEALDMDADVDEYTFTAAEGEMFLFSAELAEVTGRGHFQLVDPATGGMLLQAGLDGHTPRSGWPRWTAPRAGEFMLRAYFGQGAYRLRMFRVDTRPERVPAAIALDQTVAGEAVDPTGDVDVFAFSGTAGTEMVAMAEGPAGLWVEVLPPGDTTPLARVVAQAGAGVETNVSERVVLPADGTYRVRIDFHAPVGSTLQGPPGEYRLRLEPVRYAPESISPAIQVGQTVTGERLEHRADIDVFSFQAQAGERLRFWGEKRSASSGTVMMAIQRPGAAGTLASTWVTGPALAATLVVPETGTYEVRVFSAEANSLLPLFMSTYRGAYEFTLRREP